MGHHTMNELNTNSYILILHNFSIFRMVTSYEKLFISCALSTNCPDFIYLILFLHLFFHTQLCHDVKFSGNLKKNVNNASYSSNNYS